MNGRQGPVVRSGVVAVALCAAAACSSGTSQAHDGVQDLVTGTGFDTGQQRITGASTTFPVGQTAYVAFITDAGGAGGTVQLDLVRGGQSEPEARSLPVTVAQGRHVYTKRIDLAIAGSVQVQALYNGVVVKSLSLKVG
ncbi:hypothetical protein ACFV4F_22525 [Kitasatospora sp. NPDC059722]|uniref:hypothetical protein n=1 Tax=unclassified Kitasatospora TaxID=2633591 RepID=UPI003651C1CB